MNSRKGSLTTQKERQETERKELTLKDEGNRKIEVYKAYAEYMYNTLSELYNQKETDMNGVAFPICHPYLRHPFSCF